ncbi:MAG: 4Fe-4S binding protein [Bacteroidales bacterium]|nr:4Fe-4S binding protein [Bacteroidales bacterium]
MMVNKLKDGLVFTLKDRCRVCYTCVRECPVKAIKIINGQAEVISARCIGCGNCTRVCSQSAKKIFRQH